MGGRREILLYGRRYAKQGLEVRVPQRGRRPWSGTPAESHHFVLEVGSGTRLPAHGATLQDVASCILEFSDVSSTDVVWHCFSGGGELSLGLGRSCQHVVAIGTSASEVAELKRNLSSNAVENTTAVLCNLRSPWTLKQLSFHISQSQQKRMLLGTGLEQEKAREFALTAFVPGESRRRQMQRLAAAPFTAPLLRGDAMASQELRALLPAFVRDFRSPIGAPDATLPVPVPGLKGEEVVQREVPLEMESRLKRLYRRLALKYHPDKNPNDPEASERFQALTRAYKALVGDTAGPEEGDELAEDPYLVAVASSYRPKFKNRWRKDEPGHEDAEIKRKQVASDEEAFFGEDGQALPSQPREKRRVAKARPTEAGEQDDSRDQEVQDQQEEWAEDYSPITVTMEIDDTWAGGPVTHTKANPDQDRALPWPTQNQNEVKSFELGEKSTQLTSSGAAMPTATLLPPDVILVSQPRNRKKGKGTPRYFHTWLRATAARTIIYVSSDTEAFEADVKGLKELGYCLTRVQPFDPEPHRRSVLLVARLDLVRPLEGLKDYQQEGDRLLPGLPGFLPKQGPGPPLLGSGGYTYRLGKN